MTGSLPTEFEGGITVAWEDPAGLVLADGTLNQPEASTETRVTARITYGGSSYEKTFTILVMEEGSEYVMSYTRSNVAAALGQSMHLAISERRGKF